MTLSILQIALLFLAASAAGATAGFLYSGARLRRLKSSQASAHIQQLEALSAERDAFAESDHQLRTEVETLRSESEAVGPKLERAREALLAAEAKIAKTDKRSAVLAKNVKALLAERETTKSKISSLQGMLVAVHQKTQSLKAEFEKARAGYRRQLDKASARRQQLEQDLETARAEQQAFQKRIEKSVEEHGSAEGVIESAQLRLGQLEVLERTVEKLEREKADVEATVNRLRKDNADLKQELSRIDELKIHNQQLVLAVETLEKSRQAHEQEAEAHRDRADQSEQVSDTLRMRLADLEQGFAEMEKEQNQAIRDVRDVSVVSKPAANEDSSNPVDLTG